MSNIDGLKDTELFRAVVEAEKLKLNDKGEIEGLDEIVKDVMERKPFLFDEKKVEEDNLETGGSIDKGDTERSTTTNTLLNLGDGEKLIFKA